MSVRYPQGATALALIMWVLIASGCAGGISASSSAAAKPGPATNADTVSAAGSRPFVFRSRTELVLATSERVIARHRGSYADTGFAQDNSHIYALDNSGVLRAAQTGGGTLLPGHVDCRCDRIFPLRNTIVGWWQEPDSFVRTDLRDPNHTARVPVSLPPPIPIEPGNVVSSPRLLAAGDRVLILDQVESPPGASWGVNHLSLVDTDTGAVRRLGRIDGVNTAFDRAELRPDGQAVAVAGYARDTIACGTARLLHIDLVRGRIDPLDPPALSGCSAPADLRWDGADLTVTDMAWEPRSPDRLIAAVWNRSGMRWDRRGGDDTLRYGALTPAATLELRRTGHDRISRARSGELVLTADGQVRVLAHDVLDFRLPHA